MIPGPKFEIQAVSMDEFTEGLARHNPFNPANAQVSGN
jgi:hypothetical protein